MFWGRCLNSYTNIHISATRPGDSDKAWCALDENKSWHFLSTYGVADTSLCALMYSLI